MTLCALLLTVPGSAQTVPTFQETLNGSITINGQSIGTVGSVTVLSTVLPNQSVTRTLSGQSPVMASLVTPPYSPWPGLPNKRWAELSCARGVPVAVAPGGTATISVTSSLWTGIVTIICNVGAAGMTGTFSGDIALSSTLPPHTLVGATESEGITFVHKTGTLTGTLSGGSVLRAPGTAGNPDFVYTMSYTGSFTSPSASAPFPFTATGVTTITTVDPATGIWTATETESIGPPAPMPRYANVLLAAAMSALGLFYVRRARTRRHVAA